MADLHRTKERKAELLLFVVVIIWATNYPIAKYSLKELGPLLFNGIRFVVAALVLAILFFSRSRWTPIAAGDWYRLLRVGIVGNVVYQMAFIIGLNMTSAGNAAVLLSTAPLWTLLLGNSLHRNQIRRQMWLGMVVSIVGVAMIIVGSGKKLEIGGTDIYGDLISLSAAAFWALNTNLQKPLVSKYPTLQVTLVMMGVGAVCLGAAAIPDAFSVSWSMIHVGPVVAAVVSGALSIAVANFFWSIGVKYLGPGRTAIFTNLIPILAFIVSYFTLDEELFLIHFIGAAVTVVGVWYARR
ncbi:MAG TPA: hypothetical protein DGH68_04610 [Bacteroidetes bacterium]|nr:hypothetical protein [Bacteroidota bacterium]